MMSVAKRRHSSSTGGDGSLYLMTARCVYKWKKQTERTLCSTFRCNRFTSWFWFHVSGFLRFTRSIVAVRGMRTMSVPKITLRHSVATTLSVCRYEWRRESGKLPCSPV